MISVTFLCIITFCSCTQEISLKTIPDERELIILAAVVKTTKLDSMIEAFNANNNEYYIEQKNYLPDYENEYYDGNEKLLMDIVSDKKIDIIYLDSINMETYIGKSMLTDIYTLIDKDPDISRDCYIESILKNCENKGKLLQLPMCFYLQTTIGKESVWENDRNVSIDNLTLKVQDINAIVPAVDLIGEEYFCYYLQGMMNNFIDFDLGKCDFIDGRFEKLLKFAEMYTDFQGLTDEAFINNQSVLHYVSLSELYELDYYKSIYGSDIIFMGLPSDSLNYHTAYPYMNFSILENSKNKTGAFEFLKFYTSFEYQSEKSAFLPINKDAMYALADQEINSSHKTNNIEYPCKRESIDEIIEQINTISGISYFYGTSIPIIINEEISAFFAHDKSATEVCELIQNRISIYLDELYS